VAEPAEPQDPLGVLREHVRSAQQAAERLAAQAAPAGGQQAGGAAATGDPPRAGAGGPGRAGGAAREAPPSGWASDEEREAAAELRALVDVVESLRAMLPQELREQVTEVIRQILVLLRAIIDWLVSRLERDRRGGEVAVEDIPLL
jgi:hypothetical protein